MSQAQLLQFPDGDTVERKVNAFIFVEGGRERQVQLKINVKALPADEYDDLVFDQDISKLDLVKEILVEVLTPIAGPDGDDPLPPDEARSRVLNNQRMMSAIFDDYVTNVQNREIKGKNSRRRRGR